MTGMPQPPPGTGPAGKRLWREVLKEFELSGADLEVLRDAVVMSDQMAALIPMFSHVPTRDGKLLEQPLIKGPDGQPRVNPALVQFRLLSAARAKLLAALQVVGEAPDQVHDPGRPQKRSGFRGYQQLRAVE
jgi:hypothetical protein